MTVRSDTLSPLHDAPSRNPSALHVALFIGGWLVLLVLYTLMMDPH